MRRVRLLVTGIAALVLLAMVTPSKAADSSKEQDIKGEAKCAKCTLKEADKCQTVIETKSEAGRATKYYVVNNDVAKKFHDQICENPKKVKAVGTVKRVDGKRELTLTKIEVVDDKETAK